MQGLRRTTTARSVDLGRVADWNGPERIVGNLHRAYAEVDKSDWGEHLDLQPIIADMAAYNDGDRLRLPRVTVGAVA